MNISSQVGVGIRRGWLGPWAGRLLAIVLGLVAGCQGFGTSVGWAQETGYNEYEVKAAFLLNFAKFVEWPEAAFPNADAPLRIGVLSDNHLGPILDRIIKGQTVNNRKLTLQISGNLGDLSGCQLLFIGAAERNRVPEILKTLSGKSILTVSETPGFAQQGGVLNFIMVESKVHFEINVDAAQRTGLKINSKLLQLAKIVREK
jgi:hypothetical protein